MTRTSRPGVRLGLPAHLWVLGAYTAAALLLTWPLARYFFSHVPGDGIDDPSLAWNLWWINERVVNQLSLDIFHVGWQFHPVGINLAFYTLTPLNGLLSIPLQAALGLIAASNLLLLSSFVLGAYGMFLLARDLLPGQLAQRDERLATGAAFAAGILYAFAAPKLFYAALGQFNIASSQWIPFAALYLLRTARAQTIAAALRAGAMAALFLLLQAWAELTFASFLLLFAAIAALWAAARALRGGHSWRAPLSGFALAGAGFTLGMLPYLAAMVPDLRAEGDFFASGGGFADIFSADLAGFLLPTRLHPLWGEVAAGLPFANDKGQQIWLGYTGPLLAAAGALWLWRRARGQALFWGASTLFFWLLSLGPSLRWMGRDLGIPGPFALVSLLPFFSGNRYPSRYSVMLLLGVGVLASAGLFALLRSVARVRPGAPALVAAAVSALLLLEHLSVPLPLSDLRIPPIYTRLAAEAGEGALLELPTGWRNGARVLGKSDELIMLQEWYQSAHGKRRLGGNTSRNPAHKFQFFTDHPLVSDLIALMNSDRDDLAATMTADLDTLIARHAPVAARELADLGVKWVTVHVEQSPPALLRFVEEALPLELVESRQGQNWRGEPSEIRLYRVRPAETVTIRTVSPAGAEGAAFLAEGWSALDDAPTRYANRPAAHLLLDLPESGGQLSFDPPLPPGTQVKINGAPLISPRADTNDQPINFSAAQSGEPIDRVTITFPGDGVPVTTLAQEPSPIGATGVSLTAGNTLVVRSAGEDVGDFAEVWLNGRNLSDGERGYSLAAIDPAGALLGVARFDTFASEEESARTAAWLEQWPNGTIIAGAAGDEVSLHLTEAATNALARLGVAGDLRGRFRWSHAFVGVQGAAPGSALEVLSQVRPAELWLGAPVDGPLVYGEVRAVTIQAASR